MVVAAASPASSAVTKEYHVSAVELVALRAQNSDLKQQLAGLQHDRAADRVHVDEIKLLEARIAHQRTEVQWKAHENDTLHDLVHVLETALDKMRQQQRLVVHSKAGDQHADGRVSASASANAATGPGGELSSAAQHNSSMPGRAP